MPLRVFEPSSTSPQPPELPPQPPGPAEPTPGVPYTDLMLRRVRAGQRRALWTQGAVLGACGTLLLALVGAWLSTRWLLPGRVLLFGALPAGIAVALYCGIVMWRARAGNKARTALLISHASPELGLDVLAALELAEAMGKRDDFSPELARAFLKDLDRRSFRSNPMLAVDQVTVRRAWVTLALSAGLALVAVLISGRRIEDGLSRALSRTPKAAMVREPITGDVELTYRYPAYTALQARTIAGTSGEISAPSGTEVDLKTRADRDIEAAALDVDGTQIPLTLKGRRDLEGRFVIERNGHYHFLFLDGRSVEAEGPDVAVRVEADAPPTVHLSSPPDELEVDDDHRIVTLKYEASDDFGLSGLDLIYRVPGQPEVVVPLQHDDGRHSNGDFAWDVGALKLVPGQKVQYHLRATDNDEVSGKKSGVSRTQTLKLYSATEHRRESVKKAEAVWDRMVTQLANRMESTDRAAEKNPESVSSNATIDAEGTQIALDSTALALELSKERDAPDVLITALTNAGTQLQRDVSQTSDTRRMLIAMGKTTQRRNFALRLASVASNEIRHTEQSVLYLEALLDRVKMRDIKDLADQLKKDRHELSELLEKMKDSADEKDKARLLEEIAALREHMEELSKRMSELAKGIHDEFMNQEAMKELAEDNAPETLDDIEKLVREGKMDEAMAKLQEMSMQMDDMLKDLDEASDDADDNADPELTKKFQDFNKELDAVTQEEQQLSDKTKVLRDKYRDQMKQQIAKRGEDVKQHVLKEAQEVKQSLQKMDADEVMGARSEKPREAALQDLAHLEAALKADDFDLAAEAARDLENQTSELQTQGELQRRQDEAFGTPLDARRRNHEVSEEMKQDARKSDDIARQLDALFPQGGQQMSDSDRQQMDQQDQQQRGLEKRAQNLQQQMDDIQQRAPVFDPETEGQMERARQSMEQAAARLKGKEPGKAFSEQQGALEAMKGLQKQMESGGSSRGGKKGGLPLPMGSRRRGGRGNEHEKIEIPDEDPGRPIRDLRKDVMDAMKQGAPDRYKEQVKHSYEELVK